MTSRWSARHRIKSWVKEHYQTLVLASSLVMLSLCTLFLLEITGIRGNTINVSVEKRKAQVEALALQLSTLAEKVEVESFQGVVSDFVLSHDDVYAAALINDTGVVLAALGDTSWFEKETEASVAPKIYVPIFSDNRLWGTVQVVFAPLVNIWHEVLYFCFFTVATLLIFTAFLNRALVQLDPKRAVPERVDSAMDLFTAGVVVLDSRLRIIMVNKSAISMAGCDAGELLGRSLDDWPWKKEKGWQTPWNTTLHSGLDVSEVSLTLMHDTDEDRSLQVSCALVGGDSEAIKGVLVTMDDMTTVERQNRELTQMVGKLRQSQEVISEQNRELTLLATTDPLTGIANRRTLMEVLERNMQQAIEQGTSLCCIMTDIDHFKQVNDNYGHATGDDVIKAVAKVLKELCRDDDMVGRYGGEEFVVVLPGRSVEEAVTFAERARISVIALASTDQLPLPRLSSSFGVSDMSCGAENGGALVHAADLGLYHAKESGRNRVCVYDPEYDAEEHAEVVTVEGTEPDRQETSALDLAQARIIELEKALAQRDNELSVKNEFDSLTGMPLRRIFLQRTEAELIRGARDGTLVGVISFALRDMDRLVSTFGYAQCDELVINVLERLQSGLRSTDVVSMLSTEHMLSRITSNEYGVLLASLANTTSAMIVVTRLKRLLHEPFPLGEEKVYVGATIGIAVSSEKNISAAALFAEAGEAREAASLRQDKISHVFASNRLHQDSDDYIRLEADLHEALDLKTIETWFQPKFDLERRQITGMEALLRWKHKTRGFVSPQLFVSVAEANGLIDKLSELVLKTTLRQIVVWHSLGFFDLRVSVNISPMQLRAETLAQKTLDTLKKVGVDGRQLEIELTETTVLDNPEQARHALSQLRDAGVSISIDDFGTGYTSLSLLADLPLDVVKIDRLFVSAVESSARTRAVVGSVISMAHALNLRVVGEGVETDAQMEIMEQLGCDEVQGYLISRPLPANDMTDFLIKHRARTQERRA